MKKLIVIIVGIGLIIGLSIFAMNLKTGAKATDTSLIAFAIEDTAAVDKIEIYDSYQDQLFTVTRNKDGVWEGPDGDRKSIRLNSSHVRISYAVFCLKKKRKKIDA